MEFCKPALGFEDQAELLMRKGMGGSRQRILASLEQVGYCRLSGYWYHKADSRGGFHSGVSIEDIRYLYTFDRRLRLLLIDAIERIEVGIRTRFACYHALAHGPFAYLEDANSLPGLDVARFRWIRERISEETNRRSHEHFVSSFRARYGDRHPNLPVWMAIEMMSFGSVLGLIRGASKHVSRLISRYCGVSPEVLRSWLWSLNEVRNVCAHHGRLWNRPLGNKPMIPRKSHHPEWHVPVPIDNRRVYVVLTICGSLLSCLAPDSQWQKQLVRLLHQFPEVPLQGMGFPGGWSESPLWRDALTG
jgi:abortive infection bacteriophage resistance protein